MISSLQIGGAFGSGLGANGKPKPFGKDGNDEEGEGSLLLFFRLLCFRFLLSLFPSLLSISLGSAGHRNEDEALKEGTVDWGD